MLNNTQKRFICHLCNYLPTRRAGKRGTKPIAKEVLITQIYRLFRANCGWREIEHSSTVRNYLYEIQRRNKFKDFFTFLTLEETKYRIKKTVIDSTDIVSYKTNHLIKFSGKYHNYCFKMTIEINQNCVPILVRVDKGNEPDSIIFDKTLLNKGKLPYELFLDKGYEKYERRIKLKTKNCQLRIEMKNYANNRKRGPKFTFNKEHKNQRTTIEKVVSWIKAFMILRLCRLRKKSIMSAMAFFCASYVAFMRLPKL